MDVAIPVATYVLQRTHRLRLLPLLLALVTVACHGDERDFSGTVTRVFDGDSFIVTTIGRGEIEVRLRDIDAPEKDQPHADVARAALMRMIDGRRVYVDVVDVDKFDRKVAKVYREPDRLDVIHTLVRDGHVWVNRRYAKDKALIALEERARSQRLGLWALPSEERIAPWEFRNLMFERKTTRKKTAHARQQL